MGRSVVLLLLLLLLLLLFWPLQVSDDIMDASITRRGQPCWYKAQDPPCKGWKGQGVGMVAINDAFLIEAAIYKILKKHFKKKTYYVE